MNFCRRLYHHFFPNSNSTMKAYYAIILLFLLSPLLNSAAAQPSPINDNPYNNDYARFSPSMAIIIVVLISALFFMGFFSIYIRHCTDSSGAAGSLRRALSIRNRRGAASRGLEASVIETFPTFSYSEVKDHQIGKGALECAVCLNEFEENETLRLLPKCDHVFHPECIDAWLESHVTCPVCRANLVPTADEPAQLPEPTANDSGGTMSSENNEIVVQVDEDQQEPDPDVLNRNSSYPNRPPRSGSLHNPRVFVPAKFRSHSTGHSLIQPGENLERFTLRLPEQKRKEVMDRAALNRTGSCAATLPREASSRRGYRGEGSGWGGRFYRIERSERGAKSERWDFFTRALSIRSPKVVAEGGEGSSGGAPVKLPSFKCLEPKTVDETGLMSNDSAKSPV